ncbi:hypothetical protein Nepgr_001300 [Nepenthes gracilis]|uniref:Uncharacterized protein n=1 Tax=Nepenthes gracilis TaxID=150966 RepID=A0AAD3P4K8_NEPGR|nr:hypothetical protein Nepgr_001300 [Nepenthes gracilis]
MKSSPLSQASLPVKWRECTRESLCTFPPLASGPLSLSLSLHYSISSRIPIVVVSYWVGLEILTFLSFVLEMVVESWFRNLWRTSRKQENGFEKVVIGVLSFEVASLMSKLVHLLQSLSDKQVIRLREDITNSVGIKKLISEDDDFIVRLVCAEMIHNLGNVARAVARLGKKCADPSMNSLEHVFDDLIKVGVDMYGLEFSWRKMEKKVKKMEKLISANANLYQQMEMLVELEQNMRKMKSASDLDDMKLLEYHKKVEWKRHEVKNLQGTSLWSKTYDYAVSLMIRSIFTIFSRIRHVFGISLAGYDGEIKDSGLINLDYIHRSQSVSALMQSSVHPSNTSISRFSSGPLANTITLSGPISKSHNKYKFYSGPFGSPSAKSGQIPGAKNVWTSHSGPLEKSLTKGSPASRRSIFGLKLWHWHHRSSSTIEEEKDSHPRHRESILLGPSKGPRIPDGTKIARMEQISPSNSVDGVILNFSSNCKLLEAPPETLGAAALALHYANIIIVIEKLFASPHLIGHDARDDLYNMLPLSVRATLRARLKPYSKTLASSIYDTVLAGEWREAMTRILEWLAPLAHDMIRWQSEQSYEQQSLCARTNVFLVQTLYFANQEKTEAIIIELLVGLNYIWRFGREINSKAFVECANSTEFGDYLNDEE